MEIASTYVTAAGEVFPLKYRDAESEDELSGKQIQSAHAFCFCDDKLVVVYDAKKDCWTPPGGKVEAGEGVSEAVCREVREESSMRVCAQRLIGYQEIAEAAGVVVQVRVVCIVEPYGPFVSDPGGDITQIALIDPHEYKQYFDWGEVGQHLMIRALQKKAELS